MGSIHAIELGTENYPGDAHCKLSMLDKPGEPLVAMADVSMVAVFPTTLAVVGHMFPEMTGTAITCGWIGLVSSRMIRQQGIPSQNERELGGAFG